MPSTVPSSVSCNGSSAFRAPKKKMKPTISSPTKHPSAKPAPLAENGKFPASGREGVSSTRYPGAAAKPSPPNPLPKPPKPSPSRRRSKSSKRHSLHTSQSSETLADRKSPNSPQSQQLEGINRPRIPMGEALRLVGLDEQKIAQILASMVNRAEGKTGTAPVDNKLLMDVVKVANPHLDSPRRAAAPAAAAPAGDTLVIVNLIHEVQRPVRPTAAAIAAAAAGTVANPDGSAGTSVSDTIAIHPVPPAADEGLPI